MNKKLTIVWICSALIAANSFGASNTKALEEENADLKARVEKLEQQVDRLVQLLESKPAPTPPPGGPAGPAPYEKLDEESLQKLAQMVADQNQASGKKPVLSNLNMDIYGFIRLDAAYDDSSVADGGGGSYLKWADSGDSSDGDDQFTMTARTTRIGVNISGPEDDSGLKTSGKIEVDFSGGGSETSNELRIRQGYLNMAWADSDFSLLAGQAWDVTSPLNPPTIDFGVLWWAGNPGWRRPQLRATKGFDLGSGNKMTVQAAVVRNMGQDTLRVVGSDTKESGEEDGKPQIQGRLGFNLGDTQFGVSGHWGREEYDLDSTGTNKDFDTWSLNIDFVQPITDWLTIKGEAFTGENLNQYAAGIGQGVNTTALKEIESKGGWIAASMKPMDKWTFNVGYGVDDPENDDLESGNRTLNQAIFGNAIYAVNKNTDIGLEVQHRKTEYKDLDNGDDLRIQAMFRYKF